MQALCLLGCPTFFSLFPSPMAVHVSSLISSAVTWDFSTLILSPSSAPPPLPAAGTPPPPARSGSLASLSVSVQCNEQIEWNSQAEGDQEEGKPLSSQSTLWGHPPGPPGTFTGFSLPVSRDNAGCRGRRLPAPFWWSRPPRGKASRCKPLLPQIESKDNDNIHYHTRPGFLWKLN